MLKNFHIPRLIIAVFLLLPFSPWLSPSADARVRIARDATGMPHVYGDTNYEVFFGLGYIMAKDRLFQMEMRKRQALGTTAEILGMGDKQWPDKYLTKDREARLMHNSQLIKAEYNNLPSGDQQIIDGFTAGINRVIYDIIEAKGEFPQQFKTFGFMPAYWRPQETLTMAIDVLGAYSSFTTQPINFDLYRFLRQKFPQQCDDIFEQLLWRTDPNAPTTLMDHQQGGPNPDDHGPQGCRETAPNGLDLGNTQLSYVIPPHLEPKRSSMAWLVGGRRAEGAQSIFVNGPQVGWHNPSYYYPVGLHGGDFDLVGFAAEGTFVIEVGANAHFAWGMTAALGSQVDMYQERVDQTGDKYWHNGAFHPFDIREEKIHVKGGLEEVFIIRSNLHGPVVAQNGTGVFTNRIAWQGSGSTSVMAWVHAGRQHDFDGWLAQARAFNFAYNWFYAGQDGRVGFAYTGIYPERQPHQDIRLPASGEGGHEWLGRLPAAQNPHMLTDDYIVNFNNKPSRDWPNSGLFWEQWAGANQAHILIDAITRHNRLSVGDMWAINRIISYTDVSASYFIPFIEGAEKDVSKDDKELREAIRLLRSWDRMHTDDNHDGFFDHAGQTIYNVWLPIMVKNTLGPTLQGFEHADIWLAAGYQTQAPRLEEHPSAGTLVLYHTLMNTLGQSGMRHYYNFFGNRSANDVILDSLREALASLHKTYTGPMEGWKEKAVKQVFFDSNTNRIPMTLPGLRFNLPLYANRGAINFMAAYHDNAFQAGYVNPPGQVGDIPAGGTVDDVPLLTHQLNAYRDFTLFPAYLSPQHNQLGNSIEMEAADPFKPKL